MASFSERNGYEKVSTAIQRESLDDAVRRELFNMFYAVQENLRDESDEAPWTVVSVVSMRHFQKTRDAIPSYSNFWGGLFRNAVIQGKWNNVFDLIERTTAAYSDAASHQLGDVLTHRINEIFAEHLVAYRFVNGEITPLDTNEEAEAVDAAIADPDVPESARTHLAQAVSHLANRDERDLRNVVKESISAVESAARALGGGGGLSAALTALSKEDPAPHKALVEGWKKLYGWTSDDGGIRHGSQTVVDPGLPLAKWMLVSSAAMVTYLTDVAIGRDS